MFLPTIHYHIVIEAEKIFLSTRMETLNTCYCDDIIKYCSFVKWVNSMKRCIHVPLHSKFGWKRHSYETVTVNFLLIKIVFYESVTNIKQITDHEYRCFCAIGFLNTPKSLYIHELPIVCRCRPAELSGVVVIVVCAPFPITGLIIETHILHMYAHVSLVRCMYMKIKWNVNMTYIFKWQPFLFSL